jgi:hypothetical protein
MLKYLFDANLLIDTMVTNVFEYEINHIEIGMLQDSHLSSRYLFSRYAMHNICFKTVFPLSHRLYSKVV